MDWRDGITVNALRQAFVWGWRLSVIGFGGQAFDSSGVLGRVKLTLKILVPHVAWKALMGWVGDQNDRRNGAV